MFRRTKPEESTAAVVVKPGGKGRPTPTRREAEAASRLRAKGAKNKKQAAKTLRARRTSDNAKMRQGLRSGDERYLPARDQGKTRRFIRDLVDSRFCAAEFLLPLLVVIMIGQALGYQSFANGLWSAMILLVAVDTFVLIFKLKRQLRERFPDESTKGAVFYAILRSLQLRFLRLPKTKVKLGQKLPAHY